MIVQTQSPELKKWHLEMSVCLWSITDEIGNIGRDMLVRAF